MCTRFQRDFQPVVIGHTCNLTIPELYCRCRSSRPVIQQDTLEKQIHTGMGFICIPITLGRLRIAKSSKPAWTARDLVSVNAGYKNQAWTTQGSYWDTNFQYEVWAEASRVKIALTEPVICHLPFCWVGICAATREISKWSLPQMTWWLQAAPGSLYVHQVTSLKNALTEVV